MSEIPEQNYSQKWADDDRQRPDPTGDEREILTGMLDYYRRTLELKCTGLDQEGMSRRSMPPSTMSLHGLVRHLTGVERWWFRIQFNGEADLPMLYYSDDDPDQDFGDLEGDVDEALARWREECEVSRGIVASSASLERTGTRIHDGSSFSLRWLLVYLIAEYAHHCGHADLLREGVDGRTGQ
jgi:hypothetical protein